MRLGEMKSYEDLLGEVNKMDQQIKNMNESLLDTVSMSNMLKNLLKDILAWVYNKLGEEYPAGVCVRIAIKRLKHYIPRHVSTAPINSALDAIYQHCTVKAMELIKVWFFDVTCGIY